MNYGNPYYSGNVAQQMASFPYNYQQQVMQPMAQPPIQNQQNASMYDFMGKYVTSYEDVKNSPFVENTMIYLDTEHDRIYIKKISSEGVPEINVLGLTDIQTPNQTQELTGSNVQNVEVSVDKKIEKAVNKIEKEIEDLRKDMKISKSF